MDLGPLSSIDPTLDETTASHRDRADLRQSASQAWAASPEDLLRRACESPMQEWVYLWTGEKWLVSQVPWPEREPLPWRPLAQVLGQPDPNTKE